MSSDSYSHVRHLPLHVRDVDGGIVEDAGELLEAAVQLLGLGGGVAGALEVAGHHVLLQAQLGQLLQAGHVAVQQLQLLLLQAQRRVGFPLLPAQSTYNVTSSGHITLLSLYLQLQSKTRIPPSDGSDGGEDRAEGEEAESAEQGESAEREEGGQQTPGSRARAVTALG